MVKKEDVILQGDIFPSLVDIGIARLDEKGMIIEMDRAFFSIFDSISIQAKQLNLLDFLEKNAKNLGAEGDYTKISGEPVSEHIYRYEVPGKKELPKKKILDFRVIREDNDNTCNYTVTVTDITDNWKKDVLLRLLVDISNAILLSHGLKELIRDIRNNLGKIMDTTNFFVAVYNREKDIFSFPYFDDKKDFFEQVPAKGTISAYVLESGKTMLLREDDFKWLSREGKVELIGSDSKVWMGAPLRAGGETFGVISVQSYDDPWAYNETDKDILSIVASQIGLAIDRKRKEEDISAGRTYFEKLFHYAPVPIVIQKSPGIVTNVNEAFENLFGFSAGKVIGRSVDDVVVPEELRKEGEEITRKAFEGELIEREVVRQRSDGLRIEVALKAKAFQISPGEKIVYAIYQDISQKKEYERKLVEAKEKAEEADRLKSAFLTNMSHEIRTPMNAILGFSQLMISTAVDAENKKEYTRIILESGENLLRLIDDILDIAKIESGQMEIKKEPVDVEDLMTSLQATFLELIEKKLHKDLEIKLSIPRSAASLTIFTDPLRLKQILTNLIGNAVKFTADGTIEIGYQILKNKNMVEFFVRDTGIGIPEDKLQLIFDRFQQVDNSRTRQYSGTGLGLAISKKLTELLGGTISVKSKEGKGSTFSFTIPLVVEPEIEETSVTVQGVQDFPDLTGYKILLAEDDEINFLFMRELLKKTGVQMIRATTGLEVLEYFRKNSDIDLVLMDMEMPELNGYEATRILKEEFPDVPVIAQTAYASPEEKNKCLEAGCNDYIAKPIQMHKLYTIIRKHLML